MIALRTLLTPMPSQNPRAAWLTVGMLHLFVSLGAIAGGGMLVYAPDGSALGVPITVLRYSPFSSFLVPGLILLGVIGGGHLLAFVLVARRHPWAGLVSALFGGVLVGWIGIQILMVRGVSWLHVLYGGLGLVIGLGASVLRLRQADTAH